MCIYQSENARFPHHLCHISAFMSERLVRPVPPVTDLSVSALRADLSREREAESSATRHRPGAERLEATTRESHTGTPSPGI